MDDFEEFLNTVDNIKIEILDYRRVLKHIVTNLGFMPKSMINHGLKDEINAVLRRYDK